MLGELQTHQLRTRWALTRLCSNIIFAIVAIQIFHSASRGKGPTVKAVYKRYRRRKIALIIIAPRFRSLFDGTHGYKMSVNSP